MARALGVAPSRFGCRCEVVVGTAARSRGVKTGYWRLQSQDSLSGAMDWQIAEMLGRMTDSVAVWRNLGLRHKAEIFFGWF